MANLPPSFDSPNSDEKSDNIDNLNAVDTSIKEMPIQREPSSYATTNEMSSIKTSGLDRRLSIARTSLNLGRRWAGNSVGGLFLSKEAKATRNQAFMEEQAAYLVDELGQLKGSVVKIGQMLALYGEHFLPPEITTALQQLNDNTASLAWPIVEQTLREQLGNKLDDLHVSHKPIGTASLAQVHRATVISTGQEVVLKVQYPGVADAIDSDLSLFKKLLKVTNAVPQTRALDDWFNEIRDLLKVEVDYQAEAKTTKRFRERLQHTPNYIVPSIIDEYCSARVLCLSYEEGIAVTDPRLKSLTQSRRDALGQAAIEIMLKEIFVWGEMQTDPNFGNYLVRLAEQSDNQLNTFSDQSSALKDQSSALNKTYDKTDNKTALDQLILLDFGAMREFDAPLLTIARNMMLAGFHYDKERMLAAMQGYTFFDTMSATVKSKMADVFLLATEPFRDPTLPISLSNTLVDADGNYYWASSNLHKRLMDLAGDAMQSREFSLPPKEFMFITRKFIGAYTFLTVLNARTNTNDIMRHFVTLNP